MLVRSIYDYEPKADYKDLLKFTSLAHCVFVIFVVLGNLFKNLPWKIWVADTRLT